MLVTFVGTWLFSVTDSSFAGQQERQHFRSRFVRSQTGLSILNVGFRSIPFRFAVKFPTLSFHLHRPRPFTLGNTQSKKPHAFA